MERRPSRPSVCRTLRWAAALVLCACLLCPGAQALAQGRAYYEIFPASFYDSDGDGLGDIRGIEEKLPYLEALGVEGLWLMPIHPSPSYHKYDVVNYLAVDPGYGTLADMRALAEALHSRNMNLLLDLVLNHTSRLHPWFVSAADSLAIPPCGGEPCQSQPLCRQHNPYVGYYAFSKEAAQGWHALAEAPGWYYEGVFSPNMPDLQLDNPLVRQEIQEICRFWLEAGVDGFRLDAVLHYLGEDTGRNTAFLRWLMEELRALKPDVLVVGEAWKDAGTIARYYESGITALFNFPFAGAEGAIVNAIRSGQGVAFAKKAEAWQQTLAGYPGGEDAPFLSNHDMARIAGTLMRDPAKLKLAASLYLLLPGTPFLYYGEELGMTGSGRDENKRLPMAWGQAEGMCLPPTDADQEASSLETALQAPGREDSLWRHYQWLLALRKEHPALQIGHMTLLDTGLDQVCAYTLTQGKDRVTVLHNLGPKAVTLTLAGEEIWLQGLSTEVHIP